MNTEIITNEADWRAAIRRHNAIPGDMKDMPQHAIWFETQNFGWIISAPDEMGKRQILAKF